MDPVTRALEAAQALNDLHPDLVEKGAGLVSAIAPELEQLKQSLMAAPGSASEAP